MLDNKNVSVILFLVLTSFINSLSSHLFAGQVSTGKRELLWSLEAPEQAGRIASRPKEKLSLAETRLPLSLNPQLKKEGAIQVGQVWEIPLLDGSIFTLRFDRVAQSPTGTHTLRARVDGYPSAYMIFSITRDEALGFLQIPEEGIFYEVRRDSDGNYFLQEQEKLEHLDCLSCGSHHGPMVPPPPTKEEKKQMQSMSLFSEADPMEWVTIDVMMVYTPAARQWAETRGGIENLLNQAMEKANLALENSDVFITKRLVHTAEVFYEETGNLDIDKRRLTTSPSFQPFGASTDGYNLVGFMDEVHDWRNEFGADLVALITETGDFGGVAWLLRNAAGRPNYGFSVTRVHALNSFTHAHEMGHNMGLHHHKEQNFQPGPGLFDYSAGWRWTGNSTNRYASVMSYTGGSFFSDGLNHTSVAHFSNPNVDYDGVPTGHSTDGDNARTLRETKHVVAAYRAGPNPVLVVNPTSNLMASGIEGGPFTPAVKIYRITNNGGTSQEWVVDSPAAWLNVTPSDGIIEAGRFVDVRVELSSAAATLAAGRYSAEIVFENLITGMTQPLEAELLVNTVLTDVIGNSDLEVISGGDAAWFGQTHVTYAGGTAAQSGLLSENQESWMETVVEGPGKLSFWWKVSSAEDLDYLDFSINGDLQQRISGEPGWQLESFTLNPGANRLRWRFKKGSDASHGQNAGWVDNVVWSQSILTIEPSSGRHTSSAASDQHIAVSSNVTWTANQGGAHWITFINSSGDGDGIISYEVARNPNTSQRTAVITISGGGLQQTFRVVQEAAPPPPVLSLSTSTRNYSFWGASNETLIVSANIPWSAESEDSWILLNTSNGTNNGIISYSVGKNDALVSRTGTIRVLGDGLVRTFRVTQEAAPPPASLHLSVSSRDHGPDFANSQIFPVEANVWWSVSRSQPWITLNTLSGSNNGIVSYSISNNTSSLARSGAIIITGGGLSQTFTINQAGLKITDTGSWYFAATHLEDGWRYFDWFKGFRPGPDNWIFHGRHGWLFVEAQSTQGMFLWDVAMRRWLWTNENVYPWMYAYGPGEGWVFFFEGGRPGSRWFQRGDNGQLVSEQNLRTP